MAMKGVVEGRLEKQKSSLMFMQITPPHIWNEDLLSHYLHLTLLGFEVSNITIRMDKYGYLVVRGDQQVNEHKYLSFEETFNVPRDADLEESWGSFEDNQIYCVTIPKKRRSAHKKNGTGSAVVHEDGIRPTVHHELRPEPHGSKLGVLLMAALLLIVVAAVISFKN